MYAVDAPFQVSGKVLYHQLGPKLGRGGGLRR